MEDDIQIPNEVNNLVLALSKNEFILYSIITKTLITIDPNREKYTNSDIKNALATALKIVEIAEKEDLN